MYLVISDKKIASISTWCYIGPKIAWTLKDLIRILSNELAYPYMLIPSAVSELEEKKTHLLKQVMLLIYIVNKHLHYAAKINLN